MYVFLQFAVYSLQRANLPLLRYPLATMLFQSVGSLLVGFECICRFQPDIMVDTTGAAFIYPLFYLFGRGCKVMAYVHYPIISSVWKKAIGFIPWECI